MKCLVTGGSGFIGRHLARELLARGHAVCVASRCPPHRVEDDWPGAIAWTPADLCSARFDWHALLAPYDVIFHLAWTSLPAFANADAARDVHDNVVPGLRLLQAAAAAPRARVVFVSSGGYVYGRGSSAPIAEDHPAEPTCAYGLSKLTFERYLALFGAQHGLDYRILRVSNAFGAGQDTSRPQGVVTTFLDRAIKGLPLEIWGDGSVLRDYIHVSDIVAALVASGETSAARLGGHRIFNVGSGVGRTLNQIVDSLRAVGFAVAPTYRDGRSFDVPINILDISRAEQCLGWRPQLGFEEALRKTAHDLGWRPPAAAMPAAAMPAAAMPAAALPAAAVAWAGA